MRQPVPPTCASSRARRVTALRAPARRTCCPRVAPSIDRPAQARPLGPRGQRAGRDPRLPRPPHGPPARARRRQRALPRPGRTARGPLGLGTEFELIRDYQPDDDIRQVNWRATARIGRPMSNQYRLEQDRDLHPADRRRPALHGAARETRTILDAELDAAVRARVRRRRARRPLRRGGVRRRRSAPRSPRSGAAARPSSARSTTSRRPRRTATSSSRSGAPRAASARSWWSSATCSRKPPRGRSSAPSRSSRAATPSSSPALRTRARGARHGRGRPLADAKATVAGTSSRRERAAAARSARRARASSKRRPDRLPATLVATYLRAKSRAISEARRTPSPRTTPNSENPSAGLEPHGQLGPGREALQHSPHSTSHGTVRRPSRPPGSGLPPQRRRRAAARPAGPAPSPSAAPRSRPRRCTRSPAARARR